MSHVLVTGGAGFLGSQIVDHLRKTHVEVTALLPPWKPALVCARSIAIDLADETGIKRALQTIRPDIIVHAAGCVQGSAAELFVGNTATTVALADAMQSLDFPIRLLALGSAAEYGQSTGADRRIGEQHPCRPRTVYGHSKLASTNYIISCVERGCLQATVLRIFNLVGKVNSTKQVVGAYIDKAVAKLDDGPPRVIRTGRLDAVRDFIAIEDLLGLIEKFVATPVNAPVVNVCSGNGHKIRDLIQYLNRLSGNLFELEEPTALNLVMDGIIGDPSLLETLTPWKPRSIYDELAVAWDVALRERGNGPA